MTAQTNATAPTAANIQEHLDVAVSARKGTMYMFEYAGEVFTFNSARHITHVVIAHYNSQHSLKITRHSYIGLAAAEHARNIAPGTELTSCVCEVYSV